MSYLLIRRVLHIMLFLTINGVMNFMKYGLSLGYANLKNVL